MQSDFHGHQSSQNDIFKLINDIPFDKLNVPLFPITADTVKHLLW